MTTKSDILRLIEQRGALKDSELAILLGIAHQQVNQAVLGLAAAGGICRAPGPDCVIRNYLEPAGMPPHRAQATSGRDEMSPSLRAWPVLGRIVPGTPVARNHLTGLGFVEHALALVADADVPEGGLIGWDTRGTVPDTPGLYCFIGQRTHRMNCASSMLG